MIKAEIYSRQNYSEHACRNVFNQFPIQFMCTLYNMLKLVGVEFKQLYRDNSRSSYDY